MQEEIEVIEKEEKDAEIIEGEEGNEAKKTEVNERPAANVQAELDRKTREIESLRAKINESTKGYNPNDLNTWSDQQLHALRAAPDVKNEFKMQAEDVLMDRKVDRKMAAERERQDRESFERRRIEEFPETVDPTSPLSIRMNRIARDMRLDNSPSGLYASAKLAALEIKKPVKNPAKEAQAEKDRIAAIKASKSSGDRPRNGSVPANGTYEETLKRAGRDDDAFKAALKAKAGGMGLRIPSAGL